MSSLASSDATITGTADPDVISATNTGSGAGNVVNAGGGGDVVFGDQGLVFTDDSSNNSPLSAQSLDDAAYWSTFADTMTGTPGVPHTAVIGQTTGQADTFSVTLTAGQTISIDVDAYNVSGMTDGWYPELVLLRADQTIVALSNWTTPQPPEGGHGGAYDNTDSAIAYTAQTSGTYYIVLRGYASTPPPDGAAYLLNVAVGGHAATGSAVAGNDTLNGEDGSDFLYGGGGGDTLSGGADTDQLFGDAGDDHLSGGAGLDMLWGGDGADVLIGDDGPDTLDGGDGNDDLQGGASSDHLTGGSGNDLLDGGADQDTADYATASSSVTVDLSVTTAQVTGGAGTDTLTNIENLNGSRYADTLTGDANANVFRPGFGADHVNGAGGDDRLVWLGGNGADQFDGGDGSDALDLSESFFTTYTLDIAAGTLAAAETGETVTFANLERFYLSFGNDVVHSAGDSYVDAGQGDDVVYASLGAGEFVNGGEQVDTLYAEYFGRDRVFSINLATGESSTGGTYWGFENVHTGRLYDNVTGTDGDNEIVTGAYNDTIHAAGGNDLITGGDDSDVIDGGDGIDTASYADATGTIRVDLSTTDAQNTVSSGNDRLSGIENLIGSAYVDFLFGDGQANVFSPGMGSDEVHGGEGDDRLIWEEGGGDDLFHGDFGFDTLDLFAAAAGQGWTVDVAHGVVYQGDTNDGSVPALHVDSVEHIVATRYDDVIIGILGFTVDAGAGDDLVQLSGSGGGTYDGGSGVNTLSFAQIGSAVEFDLRVTAEQFAGGGGPITISHFSNVIGSAADDTLTGDASSNTLTGGDGGDTLSGDAGNDVLNGGTGSDTLDGGSDVDTARYKDVGSGVTVSLAVADPQDTRGAGIDTLVSIENLIGSYHADTLTGNGDSNVLQASSGNDTITGGLGDDVIDGGTGTDTARYKDVGAGVTVSLVIAGAQATVGAGSDTLISIENLIGSYHNDTLTGNGGANVLQGSDGNDTITGGLGNDTIDGGAGTDTARYKDVSAGVAVSLALSGAQNTAGAGTDTLVSIENLIGSYYNDTLTGSKGNNVLQGSDGNDTITGGLGTDTIDGGAGTDTARYKDVGTGVTVSLAITAAQNTGGAGSDTLTSIENLIGSFHNDVLTGSSGANLLQGSDGDDAIDGGLGKDTLDGGAGHDTFRFTATLGASNIDTISGFVVADDSIALGHGAFAGLSVGALGASAFYAGTAAHDSSDRIIYNASTGALLFDRDGNGHTYSAVQFATVGKNLAITAAHFAVI